ncbi:MAG: manganese efflux pump [Clostridia bacterium]|nr:manganese efflux pump [Clostridia bacterium]
MNDVTFYLNALLLGAALAIDAFSVSVVNGIYEPAVKKRRAAFIAGVFAFFQFIMPLFGWLLIKLLVSTFNVLERFIPYAALAILVALGVRSIIEGVKRSETDAPAVTLSALMLQGVATSLDALSVGLTIAEYDFLSAVVSSVIIGAVTFALCFLGVVVGKNIGKAVAKKASVIGGAVLIVIGIEIFIRGII